MCTMMTVTVKTFWRQCDPPGWYFLNLLEFIPLHSYKCFLQLWKHHKIKGIWSWKKIFDVFYNRFQEKKHPGIPPDLPWVWATWWGGLCEIQIFKFAATSDADFHLIWNPSKDGGEVERTLTEKEGWLLFPELGWGRFSQNIKEPSFVYLGGFVSCPPVL